MTKIKESSTNQANKLGMLFVCPVTYTLSKIGGRWKPIILFNLMDGEKRYSELKRSIPPITEKMLIQHLKELEADGLIERKVFPVVPPHVEYNLTPSGKELKPILKAMAGWAHKNGQQVSPDEFLKMQNRRKKSA
jgi:DNA-binding HxlR family transcriptional regulator